MLNDVANSSPIAASSEPNATRSGYWRRRLTRNVLLGVTSIGFTAAVFHVARDKPTLAFRVSMATGYTSVALIAIALLLGPWWVLRKRAIPTSTDTRRDVGLWGAAYGLLHVATGLQVHMHGQMLNYFFYGPRDRPHAVPLRLDPFGLANWTGLVATLLLVVLIGISNDRSLRSLGARKWKRWQQSTYIAAAFIALHGVAYQVMDRRAAPFVVAFMLLVGVVCALQLFGRRKRRTINSE